MPHAAAFTLPLPLLWIWFGLTALSVAYVAYDLVTNTPEMPVMKWGWVLVTLYTGPVGLLIYWFSCREPAPGTHEQFIAPLWKQSVGSTIHCMAGDATGIIVAAALTSWLRLPMGIDIWVEYAVGFAFGLLVFQALFMKDMLGGSYGEAVRRTWFAEWVSMNAVMAGMIPVMVVLMTQDMAAMEPSSLRFWGVMSLATLVGAVLAYPVNHWLVKRDLKHGMGTMRALGKGGATTATPPPAGMAEMPGMDTMPGMTHPIPTATAIPPSHANHIPVPEMPAMAGMGHDAAAAGMGGPAKPSTSTAALALVLLTTLAMLAAGYALAARYGDLTMRAGTSMGHPMKMGGGM
jgi:Domain of unknown function (DUF4396)